MKVHADFLFKSGKGYDELVALFQSNPNFIYEVNDQDKTDKRTKQSRLKGWTKLVHKRYDGYVKITKDNGCCNAEITDDSNAMQLSGSFVSWLASNAKDFVCGIDLRF